MIAALYSTDMLIGQIPEGVSSVNNDGYSITMSNTDGRTATDRLNSKLASIAKRWLRYPVNLLFRGVVSRGHLRCGHYHL